MIDYRPQAPPDHEREARRMFPIGQMEPERYVALNAHGWLLGGIFTHRFKEPEVDAWISQAGALLRDYEGLDNLRRKWLSPEEYELRHLERDARRSKAGAAILCDVDNLKPFNYANGHALGDELLRLVAATLMSMLGPWQQYGRGVYRIGGDEFLIRLPRADLAAAQTAAEDARTKIKRLPASLDAAQYEGRPLTAKFAVAAWPDGGAPAAGDLLRALDEALHHPTRDAVVTAGVELT